MTNPEDVKSLIESAGGKVESAMLFSDGHGCMTASFPLPANHWLTKDGYNDPPMPLKCGTEQSIVVAGEPWDRNRLADAVRAAGRYAVRASTMNGKEEDFDPDAMVQNFVTGLLGYYTPNALSSLDAVARD